mgnify:CR=1 FL=1
MSEHRRKPPQRGGRAARRAAQQARGRRAAQPSSPPPVPPPARSAHGAPAGGHGAGVPRPGGRAEARRAARAASRRGRRAAPPERGRGHGRRGQAPEARRRFIDYPRAGKEGFRRWIPSWRQVLGTCLTFLALLIGLIGAALFMVEMPPVNAVAKAQTNVYYWDDGKPMVTTGGDYNRQPVPLSEIPTDMQWAVIAAENETFYEDRGVDPMGVARAVVNMARGGDTQSGSTITQQYVKSTYLTNEQTITRKLRELLLSIKLGATMEKDDILEGYLNTAFYGRGAYGIQAAAQAYYGKDAAELTTSECAFLAATVNGAGYYDPAGTEVGSAAGNQRRAKARWSWILDRMVEVGKLDPAKRDEIKAAGFPKVKPPRKDSKLGGQVGYMVELANNYVVQHTGVSRKQLDQGGYRIYTTFNKKKMEQMTQAVEKVRKEHIKPDQRKADRFVQFGGASVVPGDGAIVAVYGGEDATKHFINNSDYTGAQVGSTFKPFVMAAALRDGKRNPNLPPNQGPESRTKVSPKSIYDGDSRIKLRDYNGEVWLNKENKEWHQPNDDDTDYGDITLYRAMEVSANTPFIQLGMDVGVDRVKQAAIDAGIPDTGQTYAALTPTFSLGTSAPSAIRLANAYGTFAKSGLRVDPYSVTRVVNGEGFEWKHERETQKAFEPAVANTITDMLARVMKNGTGTSAQLPDGRPAAGKTGTTDQNQTAWFAGYTPQLSTAIGMWRVDTSSEVQRFLPMYGTAGREKIHGADFPAEIWKGYMSQALQGEPVEEFDEPTPVGEEVTGIGVKPSPTQTAPPSSEPSETPSGPDPSDSPELPSPSETPGPTDTCAPWDFRCQQSQGQSSGQDNGGADGGQDNGGGNGGNGGDSGDPGGDSGGDDGGGGAIFGRTGR